MYPQPFAAFDQRLLSSDESLLNHRGHLKFLFFKFVDKNFLFKENLVHNRHLSFSQCIGIGRNVFCSSLHPYIMEDY